MDDSVRNIIIGATCGGVLLIVIVVGLVIWCSWKKRLKKCCCFGDKVHDVEGQVGIAGDGISSPSSAPAGQDNKSFQSSTTQLAAVSSLELSSEISGKQDRAQVHGEQLKKLQEWKELQQLKDAQSEELLRQENLRKEQERKELLRQENLRREQEHQELLHRENLRREQERKELLRQENLRQEQQRQEWLRLENYRQEQDRQNQLVQDRSRQAQYLKHDNLNNQQQARGRSRQRNRNKNRNRSDSRDQSDHREGDPDKTLDLHGMHVEEAINSVEEFMYDMEEIYNSNNFRRADRFLYVITGRGLHSRDRIPKIKPAVQDYLDEHDYEYEWNNMGGMVTIDLLSKRRNQF